MQEPPPARGRTVICKINQVNKAPYIKDASSFSSVSLFLLDKQSLEGFSLGNISSDSKKDTLIYLKYTRIKRMNAAK